MFDSELQRKYKLYRVCDHNNTFTILKHASFRFYKTESDMKRKGKPRSWNNVSLYSVMRLESHAKLTFSHSRYSESMGMWDEIFYYV